MVRSFFADYGAFPAAVELTGLGALSDAAVRRVKHNKPSVISIKKLLLFGTEEQVRKYISAWRQRAVVVAMR